MERIAYRYVGGGAWVVGLPARDLLEHEAAAYAEDLDANLRSAHPIYEPASLTEISVELATEIEPAAQLEAESLPRRRRKEESD